MPFTISVIVKTATDVPRVDGTVGPRDESAAARYLGYLIPTVSQLLQSALEVEHAATELAERYEEINLLYSISEVLGSVVSLPAAADDVLSVAAVGRSGAVRARTRALHAGAIGGAAPSR